MNERFIETDIDVYFPKHGRRHHVRFVLPYRGLTIPQARRKMKQAWYSHSFQDDVVHYLKQKGVLNV